MDAQATLDAWRKCGADGVDPVRFRFIEALARRAGGHRGAARRILDDRLAGLMADYGAQFDKTQGDHIGATPDRMAAPRNRPGTPAQTQAGQGLPLRRSSTGQKENGTRRSGLATLVDHLDRRASSPGPSSFGSPAAQDAGPSFSGPSELKTLRDFRSTWSKLSADQRLTQSLAKVPGNAGPLNSHQLVHRSLTLMRDLSPEYLHRFMSYVDALSWVDQAQADGGASSAGAAAPSRTESSRSKPVRGKAS